MLIDHYVNVLSNGLPSQTARSYREPTTIAKRLGWPAHIGPPRKSNVYGPYSAPFPSVCSSAMEINAGGWVEKKQSTDNQQRCLTVLCRSLLGAWLSPARAGTPTSIDSGISLLPLLYSLSYFKCDCSYSFLSCRNIISFYYYPVINIPLFLCETPR